MVATSRTAQHDGRNADALASRRMGAGETIGGRRDYLWGFGAEHNVCGAGDSDTRVAAVFMFGVIGDDGLCAAVRDWRAGCVSESAGYYVCRRWRLDDESRRTGDVRQV